MTTHWNGPELCEHVLHGLNLQFMNSNIVEKILDLVFGMTIPNPRAEYFG